MKFEVYQAANAKWRWRLKGANGEMVASGEGYTTKDKCLYAIGLVMGTDGNTPIVEV